MRHNHITEGGDDGHWAVGKTDTHVLVQIGEPLEARQARLRLSLGRALSLAGDALVAADLANDISEVHVGDDDRWRFSIGSSPGNGAPAEVTLALHDDERNADAEASLVMPRDALSAMASEIARIAYDLMPEKERMRPSGAFGSLVSTEVFLEKGERDLLKWEVEVGIVEKSLDTRHPTQLRDMCVDIDRVQSLSDISYRGALDMQQMVRDRWIGADREMYDVDREQKIRAGDLTERHVALRKRLRDVDQKLGAAISVLRDQSLERRLIRLFNEHGEPRTVNHIYHAVKYDHATIADAEGAWRVIGRSNRLTIVVAGSTSREQIEQALKRLHVAKTATRRRTLLNTLWTIMERVPA